MKNKRYGNIIQKMSYGAMFYSFSFSSIYPSADLIRFDVFNNKVKFTSLSSSYKDIVTNKYITSASIIIPKRSYFAEQIPINDTYKEINVYFWTGEEILSIGEFSQLPKDLFFQDIINLSISNKKNEEERRKKENMKISAFKNKRFFYY